MLMTGESVLMSNMTIENDAYTTESVTASNTVVGVVIGVVSTVAIIIVGLVVIFLIRSINQSIRKIFNVSRITNVIARSTET